MICNRYVCGLDTDIALIRLICDQKNEKRYHFSTEQTSVETTDRQRRKSDEKKGASELTHNGTVNGGTS